MTNHNLKYEPGLSLSDNEWLKKLWHLYSQKLNLINLMAEREGERKTLGLLETLLSRTGRGDHRVEFMMMQVRYHSDLGDLNKAEAIIDRLLDMMGETANRDIARQVFEWKALILREKTLTQKALLYYQKAEACADSDISRAGIWLDKGLALVYCNELVSAEKLLRNAITVYEKYNSVDNLGDACNNLGICLRSLGKVPEALESYTQAIRYYNRSGYKLGSALVSGNVSEIYWYHGNYNQAFKLAYDCLKLGTEAEDRISVGLSYEMLGRLHMDLGSYARSAEFLEDSVNTLELVDDRAVLALNHSYLAQCRSLMGQAKKAEDHLAISWEICRELDDPELTARLELARIGICRCLHDSTKALLMIDGHFEKYRNILTSNDTCRLHYEKASLLSQAGLLEQAKTEFATLLSGLSPTVHKSFRLGIHSLGHAIFAALNDRPLASEQRLLARALLDDILGHLSDPGLRNSFLEKPEVKSINVEK